jgi:hypothetical protein
MVNRAAAFLRINCKLQTFFIQQRLYTKTHPMNNFFRTIIAGYSAKKLGGGCLSTIIIFVIIYYALGHC